MLTVSNLIYRYPSAATPALAGISLEAASGHILGLLGPNGAGKTTLISLLAGLLPLQQGEILLNNMPLADLRREAPTRIALAPQDYAFYPMLSVMENLRCFASAAGLSRRQKQQRVAICLEFAQLQHHAKIRAERLSGGLKRRLNLAIALLAEPELLLLDEPTANVDPQSRAFLLDAVRLLAQQGTTILYTSHYMEEIEAIADHVVIMDQGQVLRAGLLANLLAEGATQLELVVDGLAVETLQTLFTHFGSVKQAGEHWQIALHTHHSQTQVLQAIEQAGGRIRQSQFGRYNLEQLFMALTHRSLRDSTC